LLSVFLCFQKVLEMLGEFFDKLTGRDRAVTDNPAEFGRWGERKAAKFIKKRGLHILDRNFTCKTGEIDIIAADESDGSVVFVEVKTRMNEKFATAESAITFAKRTRIIRAAKYFMAVHKIPSRPYRFDVVTVIANNGKPEINYYPNAFTP